MSNPDDDRSSTDDTPRMRHSHAIKCLPELAPRDTASSSWAIEHARFIAATNAFVERHGLPLAEYRDELWSSLPSRQADE
ncbi:hypothetical protein GCM10027093_09190 [Paraburkholderia jirisanensis]